MLMLLCFLCCYRFSANKDLYIKKRKKRPKRRRSADYSYIRISTRKADTAITIEKIRDRETDGQTDRHQTVALCSAVSVATEQLRQNSKSDL